MECNILAFNTLDPISTIPEWVGEMGSNVLRDKRLCSIGSKLVQTPVRRSALFKNLNFKCVDAALSFPRIGRKPPFKASAHQKRFDIPAII